MVRSMIPACPPSVIVHGFMLTVAIPLVVELAVIYDLSDAPEAIATFRQ